MKDSRFYAPAGLMLRCIPAVATENCFAMKGGTAINMFLRPMPRLSVDIDLTYVPVEKREVSLKKMGEALERMALGIEKSIPGAKVNRTKRDNRIIKLVVTLSGVGIKIEPNEVLRGTTAPPVMAHLVQKAEKLFETSSRIGIVPLADLYGGKICAALDRQHPRDLFDVKVLLESEGIGEEIRKGFIVFLASHDRPMHELLKPNLKNLTEIYENDFVGMVDEAVFLKSLYEIRDALIDKIRTTLTDKEKNFLLSLKSGEPKWDLLGIKAAEQMPGIQWKLINIKKMSATKRQEQLKNLEKVLSL